MTRMQTLRDWTIFSVASAVLTTAAIEVSGGSALAAQPTATYSCGYNIDSEGSCVITAEQQTTILSQGNGHVDFVPASTTTCGTYKAPSLLMRYTDPQCIGLMNAACTSTKGCNVDSGAR